NPAMIPESYPLLGNRDIATIRDRVEADMMCQALVQTRSVKPRVVVLRIVPIWRSGAEGTLSKYMRGDVVPTLLGFDPMFQIIYDEEVLEAFVLAVKNPEAAGNYNIAGKIFVPLSKLIDHLGKISIPLPEFLVHKNGKFIWSDNLNFDFNYLKYPFCVDGARAKEELGYDPYKVE
ncbi:MAG TPA: hypothetical protein PLN69_03905, partial [bacterium]|nr:hypothetical protein [bacterium]